MAAAPDSAAFDQRPRTVQIAMALIWWAVGIHGLLTLTMLASDAAMPFVVMLVMWLGLGLALAKRLKYARIAHLLFTIAITVDVLAASISVHRQLSLHIFINIALDVSRFGFNAVAAGLLWTPSSSAWFAFARGKGRGL
jgi:hypothetical protein